ncbi:hypothetical protein NQ314_007392 [Rhamnusium bicolor]|uniref:Lipase domain-containing protein n=1 Tax=Rhamnusium bicolor TaxID=1586634 RepID=A0AAV8YRC9_9CUCU|nr:hypothetical protein NQ314_007392 [Rhamnusium bicolor]
MNLVILLIAFSLSHTVALAGPVLVYNIAQLLSYSILVSPIRNYVSLEEDGNRISYFLVEKGDGTYEVEDLTSAPIQSRATERDVKYYLYTKSNKENGTIITNIFTNLTSSSFDPNKEVVVAIHGWKNDFSSPINAHIKDAILDKFDLNFIVVDWSSIAGRNYVTAKNAVLQIGRYIGTFIASLASTYGIPLSNISLIGHSLGAHAAGIASSALNGSIDHIVGLDPASPLISVSNKDYCLDASDAKFVQVIHTNGGLLGLSTSLGHTDYFPNGGKRQPGCGLDITGSCAHARSYEYYASSIHNNIFLSQECSSYKDYTRGKCSGSFSLMGGYSIEKE